MKTGGIIQENKKQMGAFCSCFKNKQYEKLDLNEGGNHGDGNDLGIDEDEEFLAQIALDGNDDDVDLSDQEIQKYLEKLKESENKA